MDAVCLSTGDLTANHVMANDGIQISLLITPATVPGYGLGFNFALSKFPIACLPFFLGCVHLSWPVCSAS